MRGKPLITVMKVPQKLHFAIIAVLVPMITSSCSVFGLYTAGDLNRTQTKAYRQGLSDGEASEVRAQVHRDQLEREQPPPPLNKKFYEIPIEGHQTPDGLWIESQLESKLKCNV